MIPYVQYYPYLIFAAFFLLGFLALVVSIAKR